MSTVGQAYMKKQKDASRNTQQCAPPLDKHTIQQAYYRAYYLRKKPARA